MQMQMQIVKGGGGVKSFNFSRVVQMIGQIFSFVKIFVRNFGQQSSRPVDETLTDVGTQASFIHIWFAQPTIKNVKGIVHNFFIFGQDLYFG